MNKLILCGMLRRKKELFPPFIVTLIAVLFLTGVTLMQEMLDSYLHKSNLENYGDWVVASVDEELEHPYFAESGYITTGEFLVGNDGYRNGLLMGTIGGDFDAIGGNYMQDGRMPEADNEIATNTAVLSEYGYSYELGQTITIRYHNEDMEIMEKDYILVGIVKAFDGIWNSVNSATMPDCYMTKQELESYEEIINTVYYYRLNPLYEDVDTWELAQSFMTDETEITYNEFVYNNGIWGSEEMYSGVTLAMGIVATLTIGYLLVMYIHKRRPVYFKYRSIGASKFQVRGLVAAECGIITAPAIVFGMGVSYMLAAIIGTVIGSLGEVGSFFEFNSSLFVLQVVFAVLVVIIGIIATQFAISDKKIAQNTSEIKHSKFIRLRRAAIRTKNPQKAFFKRRSIINPLQNIMFAGISAIMFGCMIFCINSFYGVYINYNFYNDKCDFNMNKYAEYEYVKEQEEFGEIVYGGARAYLGVGVDESDLQTLREISGVKTVDYEIIDGFHNFKWEGMENSENFNVIKNADNAIHPIEYYMEGMYLRKLDSLKEEVEKREDSQKIDWELVRKGEQVVLFVNVYHVDYLNLEAEATICEENTIKEGDTIRICHSFTEEETEVEVGAVYFFDEPKFTSDFYTSSYMIVGSEALARKIAVNEGVELKYNNIKINYNSFSSYQATDKQLALFAHENDLEYSSNSEFLRAQDRERMQKTAIYGSLFIVMAVAYIAIYANIFESKKIYLKKQIGTLKQIGISDSQYVKMFYGNECKILLWIFIGLVVFYLFMGRSLYIDYAKYATENVLGYSWIIKKFTDNPVILTAGYLINGLQHWLYIVSAVVMYLLMITGSYIAVKRSIGKEDR